MLEGWARANGGDQRGPPPSDDEHDELIAKYAHV